MGINCVGDIALVILLSFAVAGPQILNCLPADLRLVDNYARFGRLLKGHMLMFG